MAYVSNLAKLTIENYTSRNLHIAHYNREMEKIEAVVNKLIGNSDFLKENTLLQHIQISSEPPGEDYDRKYWFKEVNLLDEVI